MRWPWQKRVIGDPECPILYRWTLINFFGLFKVFLHHFLPDTGDRDYHNHPWPFLTLVLGGQYTDVSTRHKRGGVKIDRMHRGAIRYRSPQHTHKTFAGPKGAWTFIVVGPKVQEWGFFIRDKVRNTWDFWPWKKHEDTFGHGMQCDD